MGLADQPLEIKIGYLHQAPSRIRISLIDVPAANDGLAGAQLAIEDDNATGRFLNQRYTLIEKLVGEGDDPVAAMNALADQGASFIVTSLDADRLLKVADAGQARGETSINTSALDERLREQDCRANVIHVAPTRSMLADALAQYLIWKKWGKWMLIVGSHEKDQLFADALRHAATRFGAKIVEERVFKDNGGARRTDSGVAEIQRQMPVVTQGAPEHDVLVAADESEVFAGYLPYRTWDARPVAGSAGARAHHLGCGIRSMGGRAAAEPLHKDVSAPDDGAGHAGLDGGSDDRRGRGPRRSRRSRQDARLHQEPRTSRSRPSRARS